MPLHIHAQSNKQVEVSQISAYWNCGQNQQLFGQYQEAATIVSAATICCVPNTNAMYLANT